MPAKQLVFDAAAREALKRGADAIAEVVSVTLGPRGRNVILDKKFGAPLVISGGVTTTATVLARAMIDEGLRNLAAGAAPVALRSGMLQAADAVAAAVRKT